MTPRYEVDEVIGRGSMAVVYRARQLGTGRTVAYKRVASAQPELVARLQREAQILGRLDHPHIVGILDVVADGPGVAIVMQHAAGGTLRDVLHRRGRLPADPAARLIAALADALASAHRCGVLHGDIKPANVLFTADGHPLLADFGAAIVTDARGPGFATPEYLDPAVIGGASFDERSDIYALGVVAFELLTGRRPGDDLSLLRLALQIPDALVRVVESAIAEDPATRPSSAHLLAAAMRDAVGAPAPLRLEEGPPASGSSGSAGGPDTDPPTRRFGPPPPPREGASAAPRQVPWRRVAVAAVLAAVLPLAVVTTWRATAASPNTGKTVSAVIAPPRPPAQAMPATVAVCEGIDIPTAGRGDVVATGDLEGKGCRSWVRHDGRMLTAALSTGRLSVRVGRHGDQLLLGDWDCDGSQTVALYRPTTGEVFTFNGWAAGGRPLPSEPAILTGVVAGDPRAVVTDGCARVVVRPPDSQGV